MTIGISSAGISVPIRRLPVIDTVSQWNNTSADLIVKQFGTECRTSLGSDEDTLTLAHEASHNCMDNARADPSDVDAVFFGTVTAPELYRGCANALMDMLTASNAYTSQDVSAAERSGIMALTNAYTYISSGLAHQALAVGSDSLCRHTAPGDLRESYEGAGAGALLISDQNVIAEIFKVSSCNSNFPEFGRPEDERYIRGLMPMDSGTTHIGMMRHIDLPSAVTLMAVAPDRVHVAGDRVHPPGFGMSDHPVAGGAGNARYPALRRYRTAGGVGPYHCCFRANTGAACSETPTSISNCPLRLRSSTGSFRSGVRSSAAFVEPLSRMPWTQRCSVEREMSYSSLTSRAGLPFS